MGEEFEIDGTSMDELKRVDCKLNEELASENVKASLRYESLKLEYYQDK